MRDRLRALGALSWRDAGLLCEAWVQLLLVDVSLRLWPLHRVREWAAPRRVPKVGAGHAGAWATCERLHWLVGIASRHHMVRMFCLQRSLALQRLLGQRGIASDLQIGVQKREGQVCAHAWLEVDGRPVGETEPGRQQFLPLARP